MSTPWAGFRVSWDTDAVLELKDTGGALVRVPLVGLPTVEADWSEGSYRGHQIKGVALRPVAAELSNHDGGQPFRLELANTVLKADGFDLVWSESYRQREPDGYAPNGRPYWH